MSQFLKGSYETWVIKHLIVVYSGFNTDYGSSEPFKTLVMLCYILILNFLVRKYEVAYFREGVLDL